MIEVELKALANKLSNHVLTDNNYKLNDTEKQLNHYFKASSYLSLYNLKCDLENYISVLDIQELDIALGTENVAIRTRFVESQDFLESVYFIVKYSLTDDNHQNGISRKEIQINIDTDLNTLDELLIDNGLTYASKWSRNREIYVPLNDDFKHEICVDTNAGYGKVLEVETVVDTEEEAVLVQPKLKEILAKLGLEELDSNLLEDMFSFYQKHWQEYYGTDKLIWNDSRFVKSLGK